MRVLGCPVDVVGMARAVRILTGLVERGRAEVTPSPALVVTLNPEMVMRYRRDATFRAVIERAALLVPDGIGVVRALRRRGHPDAVRVGGADLLSAYMPEAARLGHRIALAGGAPGVAAAARVRMLEDHAGLQVVAVDAGVPGPAMATRLAAGSPDIVWAAFGAGRQEEFLARHLTEIGASVGIGVGGSLDYLAGRTRRAPARFRDAGLEWAWRLASQPWRIRRQAVLPLFWWLERREGTPLQGPG